MSLGQGFRWHTRRRAILNDNRWLFAGDRALLHAGLFTHEPRQRLFQSDQSVFASPEDRKFGNPSNPISRTSRQSLHFLKKSENFQFGLL